MVKNGIKFEFVVDYVPQNLLGGGLYTHIIITLGGGWLGHIIVTSLNKMNNVTLTLTQFLGHCLYLNW